MTEQAARTTMSGPLQGALWMGLTGLLFAGVTALVRLIGTDIPPAQAAFLRYVFGLFLVAPALLGILRVPMARKVLVLFSLRGIVHSLGVILWFFAMARIPMAEVTAIGYVSPIFVTLGAALLLGERLALRRIMAIVVALAGAVLILRPGFRELSDAHLAQLGAAVLFAGSYLLAKRLTDLAGTGAIVGMLSITVTIGLAPFALANWVSPTWLQLGGLALVAVLATAGHYTMTMAFRAAPLAVTQPVTFLQLVWATLMGLVLFAEPVDILVLTGGGVIIAAVSYINYREMVLSRRNRTPPAVATK